MRLDINISPEIYAVTALEASTRGLTQSAVIRERLGQTYGLKPDLPRRIAKMPRNKKLWAAKGQLPCPK